MKLKKIGLFGGSFNPIHNSHIKVVEEVLHKKLVDEIWIIPCYSHNFGKDLVPYEDRVKMVEFAVGRSCNVKVCDIEKKLEGVNKTYDTVIELKKRFKHDFFWICGSDCVIDFSKWYRAKDLAKEIEFIVYDRKGFKISENNLMRINKVLNNYPDNVSSSEIRGRIKNSEDVSKLLPKEVLKHIVKMEMYKK